MRWLHVRQIEVRGDKWDLPEGVPIALAQTGAQPRFMRRVGKCIEVSE